MNIEEKLKNLDIIQLRKISNELKNYRPAPKTKYAGTGNKYSTVNEEMEKEKYLYIDGQLGL